MESVAVVIMLFGCRAMNLDDKVCYCFHVTRRKLVNWVRLNAPKVPSQLSECGGAGTGCGWCIPFLKQIFQQGMEPAIGDLSPSPETLEALTPEEYALRRAEYVKAGKGTPPPGAEPLPKPS
jgi:bacterioferritin-associated ferredoxin